MEIEKLKAFAAVAETGSFTRAAEKLYTSHSSISRAVSALERELGVKLIERDNRVVGLTGAGEILLKGAKDILEREETLKKEIEKSAKK